MLLLFSIACGGGAESDALDSAAPSDSTTGGDSAPACASVNPGEDWAWSGECPHPGRRG